MSKLTYGAVLDGTFFSDNMRVNVSVDDGFYSIDVESDEYLDSIQPADMIEFNNYVKKAKRMNYIYGYSFLDKFIPMNCINWKLPVEIRNSVADDWEIIKVLQITENPGIFKFIYFESVFNNLTPKLLELKDLFNAGKNIIGIKDVTPEMRLLFSFHLFEKQKKEIELQKLKEAEFRKTVGGRLKTIIEATGGTLIEYKTMNRGYEVVWEYANERFNTWTDKNFHVIEAGVCVDGHDKIHSMSSIINVVKLGVEEGIRFHKTRR
jgi:hypothetical protein